MVKGNYIRQKEISGKARFLKLLLSIFSCILIIILQNAVLFLLLYFPLSLWNVHPVFPTVIAGLMLPIQILLSANIFSLFFMPLPNEPEEEKENREKYEKTIKTVLDESGIKRTSILVINDEVPLVMSFGRISGKKFFVVSTGAFSLLTDEEMKILIQREICLLKRPDTGFFTSAVFVPFILAVMSAWFYESARLTRLKKGTAAPYLAGIILNRVREVAEFLILFISRGRHGNADRFAVNKESHNTSLLASAVEKLSEVFIRPVKSGAPFRKHIFTSLRPFLPFDPIKASNIKIWRMFFSKNSWRENCFLSDGIYLEKNNYVFKLNNLLSSHPPLSDRFPAEEPASPPEVFGELSRETKSDFIINKLPLLGFLAGLLGVAFFKLWFGVPFILAGTAMIARMVIFIRKTGHTSENSFKNYSPVKIDGKVNNFLIPDEIESRYSFIVGENRNIPVSLRQVIRSEEALLFLQEDEVEVEGIVRIEDIPFVDITKIVRPGKKPYMLRSANTIFQFLTASGLILAGALFLAIQIML
jgi:Zn-dependent protease with chaperone function